MFVKCSGTNFGGLSNDTRRNTRWSKTLTGLGADREGVVYVSTWYGGIYKMISNNPVFFVDADNIPRSVIGRPNGDIWINNYGGNGTLGTVRHYTANGQLLSRMNTFNSGLPDYFIDRITRDSTGNMWFACDEGGLSRMLGSNGAPDAATHWRNWSNHNDLSEPYPWAGDEPMYSVFEDTAGIFWMGGNGVGRWDSATGQFTGFWNWQNSNLDSSGHHAITRRAGTIWVGSGGSGVYWFDGTNWNHVTLSPGGYSYESNNVRSMTVDTDNNLWVASEYGLRKFETGNNTTFTLYDTSNTPLTSSGMTDVEADPNGGIWVGTYEGFARFDGTTWTLYNQANTGMPGVVVANVARRSSDGRGPARRCRSRPSIRGRGALPRSSERPRRSCAAWSRGTSSRAVCSCDGLREIRSPSASARSPTTYLHWQPYTSQRSSRTTGPHRTSVAGPPAA